MPPSNKSVSWSLREVKKMTENVSPK